MFTSLYPLEDNVSFISQSSQRIDRSCYALDYHESSGGFVSGFFAHVSTMFTVFGYTNFYLRTTYLSTCYGDVLR